MPTWIWSGGALLVICAVFVVWRLVQLTKQPRTYFRAGNADPTRDGNAMGEHGSRAPESVRESVTPGALESTVDEEAAEFIQGPRHDAPPITEGVDREVGGLLDETLGDPETRNPTPTEGHLGHDESEPHERERRLTAAAEHRRAAEEHRRAAEALTPEDEERGERAPADRPADGPQQPRHGRWHH
ncbi:hypothetical protein [Halostreptopolyspora alba]|uniref:Uncharacterized protein n=1 Tax=Halostreptopolyspora alba TaxID=2487137 RepID=A0A3N0EHM0_9ACTN|nr:hypothetical protein EFW17_00740 [Nocardiopsaceae bacterium YIM 96095]